MLRRAFPRSPSLQHVTTHHPRQPCCRRRQIPTPFPTGQIPVTSRAAYSSSATTTSSSTEPQHTSLSMFLGYAKRTNLDRNSTTFTGTYYEYVTQALLGKYGFELTRIGGRGDRGVDLKGVWRIITSGGSTATEQQKEKEKVESEITVVVQCKRLKGKVGPNLIRELEGAVATGKKGGNTIGVLVGTRGATKGVREAMGRSRVGICWVMLEVEEGGGDMEEMAEEGEEEQKEGFDGIFQAMKDEIVSKAPGAVRDMVQPEAHEAANGSGEGKPKQLGRVCQMLWNRAASDMGLEGLEVVMKYDGTRDENGEVGKEVKLMWQGKSVLEVPEENAD